MYDLVYKVAEAEGAVAKLSEQLASSEARVAKLEGIVEEQRRSLEAVEKRLNCHHFALNKAEDQVSLQILERNALLS